MREEDKKERLRRSICGGRGIEDRMFWVRGRGRVLGELGARGFDSRNQEISS